MIDVCCIGILVADCISKTVDVLPERGKLSLIDSLKLYSGGCAMSASIDLAKLGAETAVLGMVGEDGFGRFLESELKKYGVNTKGLVFAEEYDTSASVVLVDSNGERSFLHCTGANAKFTDKDVDRSIIESAGIVFVAGCMLMPAFDGVPCSRILKQSKELGKITVLDTAWDDTGRWMEVLKPCLPFVDYFIPSYEEAVQLTKRNEPEEIAGLFFEHGVGHVVIKLGAKGCFVKNRPEEKGRIIPTYSHIKPVDTTGAGDSFCAGFLYGLSRKMSIYESAKVGNAVGTHCIMKVGATTGIVSFSEIKKFMAENEMI